MDELRSKPPADFPNWHGASTVEDDHAIAQPILKVHVRCYHGWNALSKKFVNAFVRTARLLKINNGRRPCEPDPLVDSFAPSNRNLGVDFAAGKHHLASPTAEYERKE